MYVFWELLGLPTLNPIGLIAMIFTGSFLLELLLLLTVAVVGIHVLIERRRNHWQLIDPLNIMFGVFIIIYVFEPIAYFDALRSAYGETTLLRTQCYVIWAMICLTVGYHLPVSRRIGLALPSMPSRLRPELLHASGFAMIIIGLLGYAYSISSVGSISEWLSVGRGGTDYMSISGYGYMLESFLPIGVVLLALGVELNPTPIGFRVFIWILCGLQWLWFVYLGSRGRTILFLMTCAAIFFLPRRKNPPLWATAIVAAALFLLASFQAHYRGQFTGLSFHFDELSWSEVRARILPVTLGGTLGENNGASLGDLEYNCIAAVVDCVPEYVPYNYGGTLLELLTHGVPRAVWPEKRYPLFEYQTPIMEMRDLSRNWSFTPTSAYLSGPSFTFVGYWFHAGGAIGLFLGGLFTGSMMRWIRMYHDREPGSHGNLVFYLILLPIAFSDAATNPFWWVFSMAISILPLIIFLFWARVRQESHVPAPQLT
jgi:hypothetical protein